MAAPPAWGAPLSPREVQVLMLYAAWLRHEEIGRALYLAPETVKIYSTKAREKLNARTTTAAVGCAYRRGDLAETHGLAAAIAVRVGRAETLDEDLLREIRVLIPRLPRHAAWLEADDA